MMGVSSAISVPDDKRKPQCYIDLPENEDGITVVPTVMQPLDESVTELRPEPFLVAPSPWLCKGELFWFFDYSWGKSYPGKVQFSDFEAASPWTDPQETGGYEGGIQYLMIIRYKDTPVGMSRHRPVFPLFTSLKIGWKAPTMN